MTAADEARQMTAADETTGGVGVRPARAEDAEAILALVPRLVEFGPPPWHDPARMTARDREVIAGVLAAPSPEAAVFVAEGEADELLGFIHLNTAVDYFTREPQAHVSDIVVARAGEGRGVGRALMSAGEAWARSRGYRMITLSAFAENARARRFYELLGYDPEMVKYVKELR